MTGYINNNIYSQYQLQPNFGMVNPQSSQQFAGVVTPQSLQDSSHEPGLVETLTSPFSLLFMPLTLSDHNVKKEIKAASEQYGVKISKDPSKKLFGKWSYMPKVDATNLQQGAMSNLGKDLKAIDYKNIWKESVVNPHNAEMYKSFAKQGKTAQEIQAIVGQKHDIKAIETAIKDVKVGGKFMNGVRGVIGQGAAGQFLRKIPVLQTVLFGAGEIFEISAASKYGTGETVKQVGRSAATVAGDITAFSAGTSAGAKIGAKIGNAIKPGWGSIIGGTIGGFVGGMTASHVVRKTINFVYDGIFGKAKHKEAEQQEALAAQTQAQAPQQVAAPQGPAGYPISGNISLGDQGMLSNMNSSYNMYQMVA